MPIERYLCVGGVEVANPCRTLAYFRALGNACMPRPPSAQSCCCCPDWMPGDCSLTVSAGLDAGADEFCWGLFSIAGGSGNYFSTWDVLAAGAPDCPTVRPANPDPDDPGWTRVVADELPLPYSVCSPYEVDPYALVGCGWVRWTITDVETAASATLLFWIDTAVSPFDAGESAVSFDYGETWHVGVAEHTYDLSCPAGEYVLWFDARAEAEQVCLGVLGLAGGTGDALQVTTRYAPAAAPVNVASLPAIDDPAWVLTGSGTMPAPLAPLGSCNPYGVLPDGFFETTIVDTGNGTTLRMIAALNGSLIGPGDFGGSSATTDGGATWQTITGPLTLTFSFPSPLADTFTVPELDDAPWYDPAVPESADVLGVWIEEAQLSVPYERDARARQRGVSLSRGRLGGRELLLVGWLYARTEAATAYGRQWLFEALAGDSCDDACTLPDAQVWTHCDREVRNGGRRTLRRVGLTSYDPEVEPEFPRSCGFKFEATLTAEVPELLLDPALVLSAELDGVEPVCNVCRPCPPATSGCDCGGLDERLREVPQADPASAFCEPPAVMRTCHVIEPPNYWRDATAIVTVNAGTWPGDPTRPGLANLHLRAWPNPAGLDVFDASFDCQEPCLDVEVACIPAGSQLVIDGTTRQATLVCELQQRNGYAYLSSGGGRRFSWPDVSCHGLLLCAEADPLNTAPGSTISVEFVLRERG